MKQQSILKKKDKKSKVCRIVRVDNRIKITSVAPKQGPKVDFSLASTGVRFFAKGQWVK